MGIDPELLLTKGLFPENLPPVYTTKNIWPALSPDVTTYSVTGKVVGDLCVYNASKRGGSTEAIWYTASSFSQGPGLFLRAALGGLAAPIRCSAGFRFSSNH